MLQWEREPATSFSLLVDFGRGVGLTALCETVERFSGLHKQCRPVPLFSAVGSAISRQRGFCLLMLAAYDRVTLLKQRPQARIAGRETPRCPTRAQDSTVTTGVALLPLLIRAGRSVG